MTMTTLIQNEQKKATVEILKRSFLKEIQGGE